MTQAAEEPDVADVTPIIPIVEVELDGQTFPFKLAYRKDGKRIVEDFEARAHPPFAVYRRFAEFDAEATRTPLLPERVDAALRRLMRISLTDESAARFLRLVEGDEDEVGIVNAEAIGGVIDIIRGRYFNIKAVPTPPSSSSGRSGAGAGSKAKRSATKSTSKRSPSRKR